MFISIMHWALSQGSEVIKGFKLIFADDFLILSKKDDRQFNIALIEFPIDFKGPAASLQLESNMINADKRFWQIISLGNWKRNYPDNLLLAA